MTDPAASVMVHAVTDEMVEAGTRALVASGRLSAEGMSSDRLLVREILEAALTATGHDELKRARLSFLAEPTAERGLAYLRLGRSFYVSSDLLFACVDEILERSR